ncbi:MAG: glycosyltransferase [Akkermansia muciniphila]
MPLVSIIIPCYNVAPFMKKCLDAVCAQTLRDIEIICINDGSRDGTLDILREYQAGDERFIVIDQPNAGVAAARNAGLDAASGEYIGFVDPDDCISPVMFQRLHLAAEEYRADIVCMGATIVGDMPLSVRWSMLNGLQCPEWHCDHYDFATMGPFSELCWDKLYRTEFLKKTGLRFRAGMRQGSDALFNNLLQPYVKRIVKIPDCLYIYRPTRPDSLVNVYKAPDKKGSGFYPALERIDLIAEAYREQSVLEKARITVLNWLNGSIQLFSSNLLNQTAGEKKEALDAVRALLDKYGWREFARSPESPFRLLKHIAKGNDLRVRCALFGIYRVLHSRMGTKLVDLCTRIINLRGSAR